MAGDGKLPKHRDKARERDGKAGEPRRVDDGVTTDPRVKIWDEDSQRFMESLSHDRKQATEQDYEQLGRTGDGVTRGDAAND
jgi:hypothetical protein